MRSMCAANRNRLAIPIVNPPRMVPEIKAGADNAPRSSPTVLHGSFSTLRNMIHVATATLARDSH